MTNEEMFDYIDGFYTYDTGCTDLGIHDPNRKEEIKKCILSLTEDEQRIVITKYIQMAFTCDEAIEAGYGFEDVVAFFSWVEDYLGWDLWYLKGGTNDN